MSEQAQARKARRTLVGVVTSRSGDKSVKVVYSYKVPHPAYHKEINRKTVIHVHDEKNECGLGDKVEVMETRPISKNKRFRVVRIVEKAPEALSAVE
ncbi:MAG: 30S ribosomal protein S17 [Verrucomicrobia bacterium]|nr:MAG: 30S ribosomal protein S17 [Verrucomicrobiota bacterium]